MFPNWFSVFRIYTGIRSVRTIIFLKFYLFFDLFPIVNGACLFYLTFVLILDTLIIFVKVYINFYTKQSVTAVTAGIIKNRRRHEFSSGVKISSRSNNSSQRAFEESTVFPSKMSQSAEKETYLFTLVPSLLILHFLTQTGPHVNTWVGSKSCTLIR